MAAASLYKAQEAIKTCDDHQHEELSCFCRTCKVFICTMCAKTTHNGHDWDLVSNVAKKRRRELPIQCQKIKKDNIPQCHEKLHVVYGNISAVETAGEEDVKTLEDRRSAVINTVNRIIDEEKRKREEWVTNQSTEIQEQSRPFEAKIEYLEKMTTCLGSNIDAYNDHDLLEMDQTMLKTLEEVKLYDVISVLPRLKFVPGKINVNQMKEMIGNVEETTTTSTNVSTM